MPADYLACVDGYTKKGVSEKIAKARCAAWFYKKHGYTVNEAHDKGWGSAPAIEGMGNDVDFNLVELIMRDLSDLEKELNASNKQVKLTKKEEKQDVELADQSTSTIEAMNIDMLDDFNIVEIVAAKVGSKAFTSLGTAVTWTLEGLKSAETTWALKKVSINHEPVYHGIILSSFIIGNELRMLLKVSDEIKAWIKTAPKLIGVSIEALKVKIKNYEVISAQGDGVTFIFPPVEPACPISEGCGIVANDKSQDKPVEIEQKTTEIIVNSVTATTDTNTTISSVTIPANTFVYDWTVPIVWPTDWDWSKYKVEIKPLPLDNNNEENINSNKPQNGDNMVDEIKTPETICAKKHESLMKEKDSQIEVLNKELETLKASLAKFEDEKKLTVLEAIKAEGVDVEQYKSDPIATLEKLLTTVKAYKMKVASATVVDSGAVIKANDVKTEPDGDAMAKAKEQAEVEAKTKAEIEAVKIKDIDEKAKKFGY